MPNDHDWYKQNIILTGKENGTIGTTDSSSSASVTIDTQTADGKQTMLNGKFPIYIDKDNPQITVIFQDSYAFQGWHDGETHVGSAGDSYKVELNITLTAVWRSLDTAPNPYAVVIDGTKFSPDVDLTRGMLVTILYRLENEPATGSCPFSDVAKNAYYADPIAWAAAHEIVTGYSDTTFGPDDSLTREQLATILYRYAQYKGYDVSVGEDTNILSYKDFDEIHTYAIPAMQWACGAGILQGSSGALHPTATATRAQVATILMRYCEQ